jgi:hypothetical protein
LISSSSYHIIFQSNQAASALGLYFLFISSFQYLALALYIATAASNIAFLFSGVSFCHLPITLSIFVSNCCLRFNELCNNATSHSLTVAPGSTILWNALINDISLNQSLVMSLHISAITVSACHLTSFAFLYSKLLSISVVIASRCFICVGVNSELIPCFSASLYSSLRHCLLANFATSILSLLVIQPLLTNCKYVSFIGF